MNEDIDIIDFQEEHAQDFADLNYEWIDHFFEIEEVDRKYLDHPQEMIIDKGGAILLARQKDKIVGTIALSKWSEGIYELTKMSVSPELRGKKIGHKLMDACLNRAQYLGAHMVVILSNRRLENAIYLYRKYHFVEVPQGDEDYERCNIRMELKL